MARSTESNDSGQPTGPDKQAWRHFGDGFAGRLVAARLQAYNPTTLAYQDVTVDNASGGLVTSGGGGGGGAATIADGADVAQGTTTDLSSANTVIGLLKAIKAFLAGTLTVSGSLGRSWTLSSGTDSVAATDGGGSLTVDAPVGTPLWVRLSDGAAAFVGQKAMAASIPVVIASDQSSLPTTEARLPTALGANGGLKIEGVASGTVVPVSGTVTANAGTGPFPVSDNAGSLTVDAPVGTPAFVRLSDGVAAITTLPVSIATNTPDVTDRAARLLGVVSGAANVFHIDDNAGSVTVDAPVGTPVFTRLSDGAAALIGSKVSASSLPVVIASDQAAVPVTAPTLTKGSQGANGWSVQDLKDSGRVNIIWTAEFAHAQVAETMLTLTESRDGAAATTAASKVVTSGKRLRITSIAMEVEALGTGTTPQRAYLRLRFNTAGAAATGSALNGVWGLGVTTAIVKASEKESWSFPDGIEFLGDGTKQIGFSLETPDWVVTTGTGRTKITITAFEY